MERVEVLGEVSVLALHDESNATYLLSGKAAAEKYKEEPAQAGKTPDLKETMFKLA
jgi:hypothetical protein